MYLTPVYFHWLVWALQKWFCVLWPPLSARKGLSSAHFGDSTWKPSSGIENAVVSLQVLETRSRSLFYLMASLCASYLQKVKFYYYLCSIDCFLAVATGKPLKRKSALLQGVPWAWDKESAGHFFEVSYFILKNLTYCIRLHDISIYFHVKVIFSHPKRKQSLNKPVSKGRLPSAPITVPRSWDGVQRGVTYSVGSLLLPACSPSCACLNVVSLNEK